LPIKVASKKKSTDQITNAIKQNSNIALNTHRIVEGETMSSIAGDYYDDVNKYSVIAQANPNVDPARLQIGVLLVIPPR
jgi:nucleoid-associated protein YgaU